MVLKNARKIFLKISQIWRKVFIVANMIIIIYIIMLKLNQTILRFRK